MDNITTLRDTSNINWRNIFYFIVYCESNLDTLQEQCIDFEDIQTAYDLMAVMLNLAFRNIKKFGIEQKYEYENIITSNPRGRIDLTKSIATGRILRNQYVCKVTKTTTNTKANQKIKLAFNIMLRHKDKMQEKYRRYIYNCLSELSDVDDITVRDRSLHSRYQVKHYYKAALAISQLIISNTLIMDKEDNMNAFAPSHSLVLSTLWENFLRKFSADYIGTIDKDYIVEKKSLKFSDIDTIIPDIIIYKDRDDSTLLVLDAKWYENPDLTEQVRFQLHSYATQISNVIHKSNTVVSAVFGFDKDGSIAQRVIKTPNGFQYTMNGYIINVNQDFEKIKQDIRNMVDDQLELSETA